MRRRRRKSSGLGWTIALVAVAALAWFGRDYWMAYLPSSHAPATAQSIDSVVEAPAPAPAPAPEVAVGAPAAATTTVAPAPTPPTMSMIEAEARDAAARNAREQTLKVQRQLREAQQAHKEQADAAANDKNTRCIGGQKMKRVDNGWVQAGAC
ncbi:hypothetical protein LK996_14415 [Lysobacter sp. A6]|uniref:Uncharacterized protein n=1 Tax=Noviluteimonas lactosilytica TaxID=2888523 RepID=A0ABS8JKY3_9GAMM|nr:hypothetical protein [Lysobacter lactosilyticus]MCC8364266.1 hypothetical protein [Lysobacter lactosilyticus]